MAAKPACLAGHSLPHLRRTSIDGGYLRLLPATPPAFDAIHTPYLFGYPLNAIIYAVKYGKRLEMTGALAD
jgi:hypothetical protein